MILLKITVIARTQISIVINLKLLYSLAAYNYKALADCVNYTHRVDVYFNSVNDRRNNNINGQVLVGTLIKTGIRVDRLISRLTTKQKGN